MTRKLVSVLSTQGNPKKTFFFAQECAFDWDTCKGQVVTQDFCYFDSPSLTATIVTVTWHCEKHATWTLPYCRSCHIGEHEACTGEFKAPWNMDGICHCVACGRGHPRYKEQEINV